MRRREAKIGLNGVFALIATCFLFFYLFTYQVSNNYLFFPRPSTYQASDSIVQFEGRDGTKLAAYWGPTPGAKLTVVYFHGNAEDIGDLQMILRNYQLQGFNVLCLDYRGFGLSEGKALEKNTFEDANSLVDYAVANLGVDENRVVYHGSSVGGGVAMEMATARPAAGLILESTFLSVFQMYLPVKWIPGDKYVNSRKAPKVTCPTLIVHGREDEVVPFSHGERLAGMIREDLVKTLWVDNAGHNDLILKEGARYWPAIRSFLASIPQH